LFPFFEFFSQFSSCDSRKLIFISLFFSYVYYDFALNVLSFFSKFRLAAAARKKEGKKIKGGSTKKTKKKCEAQQLHSLQNNIRVSKVYCGSAFEPGAYGLPYYCTSICVRTTHDARTCTLMPNKSLTLSASACQVSLH